MIDALNEVRRQAREGGWSSRHVVQKSFMQGYASRVSRRLQETRRVATAAAEPSHLPVLRSRSQAVEDEMGKLRFRKSRSGGGQTDRTSYSRGHEAGSRANLGGTGVQGGSTKALGR